MTKSTIPEKYVIKTDNLSVLSLKLNKSEKNLNGFLKKINSSEMNVVENLIDSEQVQATAVLQLNFTNLTSSSNRFCNFTSIG